MDSWKRWAARYVSWNDAAFRPDTNRVSNLPVSSKAWASSIPP